MLENQPDLFVKEMRSCKIRICYRAEHAQFLREQETVGLASTPLDDGRIQLLTCAGIEGTVICRPYGWVFES